MNRKINHGSMDEILKDELTNPKCFEGGNPLPLSLAERVKEMEDHDPGGKKAHELAKKYK